MSASVSLLVPATTMRRPSENTVTTAYATLVVESRLHRLWSDANGRPTPLSVVSSVETTVLVHVAPDTVARRRPHPPPRSGDRRTDLAVVVVCGVDRPERDLSRLVGAVDTGCDAGPGFSRFAANVPESTEPDVRRRASALLAAGVLVYGSPSSIVAQLGAYVAAGADEIVLDFGLVAAVHGDGAAFADTALVAGELKVVGLHSAPTPSERAPDGAPRRPDGGTASAASDPGTDAVLVDGLVLDVSRFDTEPTHGSQIPVSGRSPSTGSHTDTPKGGEPTC